jgi:DtxR family Mn-dependent transcriptional regulator
LEAELSQEAEEYVEIIYKLQKRNGLAKTKDLADNLHVVPGSITNTIEHLESHGLVIHEPYRGVKLTRAGERFALDILRRHRLAERLLTDILKADWSNVHEDACKLEHALTKNLTDLLEERLGYPKFCPHGNPIPNSLGEIDEGTSIALNEANLGEHYVVVKIVDEENVDMGTLSYKGIKPGAILHIEKQDQSSLIVNVNGKSQELNTEVTSCIFLKKPRRHGDAV